MSGGTPPSIMLAAGDVQVTVQGSSDDDLKEVVMAAHNEFKWLSDGHCSFVVDPMAGIGSLD